MLALVYAICFYYYACDLVSTGCWGLGRRLPIDELAFFVFIGLRFAFAPLS